MRRLDRQITDLNEISDILNKAKIMHMAMVENGFPYVLPLNFGYEFENGVLELDLPKKQETVPANHRIEIQ